MERKTSQPNVVPEAALLHFAFTQRQYVAVYNAVAFFAKKLVSPRQKEIALSALGVLMAPTGFSLPSEVSVGESAPVHEGPSSAEPPARSRKGLDALVRSTQGRKK